MFKINFRITTKTSDLLNLSDKEISEGAHVEGFFQFKVNDKEYGYFKEGILEEGEEGFDLITTWFEGLLTTLIALKNGNSYVVLSDIESYKIWMEFKSLKSGMINISLIEAEMKDGSKQVETKPPENIAYNNWKDEIVSYNEIYTEIIRKAEEYLASIREINAKLADGPRMIELKKLIDNITI